MCEKKAPCYVMAFHSSVKFETELVAFHVPPLLGMTLGVMGTGPRSSAV